MPVIRRADQRRIETPNAVMTTHASPTQGGAAAALWRVDMRPGQCGPAHVLDAEQIWTVLAGAATVTVGGEDHALVAGDAIVVPAAAERRIAADPRAGLAAVVTAPAGARALMPDGTDRGVPPWMA